MKSLRITIESHEIPWNQSPCKSHEYAHLGWLNPIKSQYKAASYHLRWSTVSSLSFMHTDTMTSFAKVHCSCRQESLAVKLEGSYGLIFYICGDLMGFNGILWWLIGISPAMVWYGFTTFNNQLKLGGEIVPSNPDAYNHHHHHHHHHHQRQLMWNGVIPSTYIIFHKGS